MIYFVGFCLGMLAGIIATLWYISVKAKKSMDDINKLFKNQ